MSNRPGNPITITPLNLKGVEAGYESKLRGESLWPLKWLDVSWRSGWFQAKKDLAKNPELAMKPRRKSFGKRKGNK
jgi:hypothetical protein